MTYSTVIPRQMVSNLGHIACSPICALLLWRDGAEGFEPLPAELVELWETEGLEDLRASDAEGTGMMPADYAELMVAVRCDHCGVRLAA